ncbi:MAG TPA: polymer-forming cytoskeletal protein [Vicinamibacteria bacterium]|jgi:cytoskeletal protein CcmA (bactofilin family)
MNAEKSTVIDAHADVEGKLRGKDAQILGRFQGEIELSGRLQMGDGSRAQAIVTADVAEIGGEFKGELKVRSLVLLEKGRIEGSVEAQTIAVREGAQLNGSVNVGTALRPPAAIVASAARPAGGMLAG